MVGTLADVKLALSRKYDRLAKVASSKPKRRNFANKARSYQRQAEQLLRG